MNFDLRPYSLETLPKDPELLNQQANDTVESVDSWQKLKTYTYRVNSGQTVDVATFKTVLDGVPWFSRKSEIKCVGGLDYETFIRCSTGAQLEAGEWKVADISAHTRHEAQYMDIISDYTINELEIAPEWSQLTDNDKHALSQHWYSATIEYDLGFPLKKRQFHEFIYVQRPTSDVSFVISLISSQKTSSDKIKAVYVSIERIKYNPTANSIQWDMCTTSDAGGSLPQWLQNMNIPKTISKDVPHFINYALKK